MNGETASWLCHSFAMGWVLRDDRSIADANWADTGPASARNPLAPTRHAASREPRGDTSDCDPNHPFDMRSPTLRRATTDAAPVLERRASRLPPNPRDAIPVTRYRYGWDEPR